VRALRLRAARASNERFAGAGAKVEAAGA